MRKIRIGNTKRTRTRNIKIYAIYLFHGGIRNEEYADNRKGSYSLTITTIVTFINQYT